MRSPAAHACERCDAPLALLDFGSTPGSYNCSTVCESSVGAAHEVHDGASFEASNCQTSCHFLEMELYGGAVLTTSPYFPGTEPSDALHAARANAAAVADAERFAWDRVAETRAAVGAAGEQVERRAARLAALLAASARADAAVADALYIEARAARDLEEYERGGQVRNYRSARGALEKATADRIASEEFAAATLADYEAAAAPPLRRRSRCSLRRPRRRPRWSRSTPRATRPRRRRRRPRSQVCSSCRSRRPSPPGGARTCGDARRWRSRRRRCCG